MWFFYMMGVCLTVLMFAGTAFVVVYTVAQIKYIMEKWLKK